MSVLGGRAALLCSLFSDLTRCAVSDPTVRRHGRKSKRLKIIFSFSFFPAEHFHAYFLFHTQTDDTLSAFPSLRLGFISPLRKRQEHFSILVVRV